MAVEVEEATQPEGGRQMNGQTTALLVSVEEAAHMMGISKRSLLRLIAGGKFPRPLPIGNRSLIAVEDVHAFIEKLKQERNRT